MFNGCCSRSKSVFFFLEVNKVFMFNEFVYNIQNENTRRIADVTESIVCLDFRDEL